MEKKYNYLAITLSNCSYSGSVFIEDIENLESKIRNEFESIEGLEFRGIGCSMVRGGSDDSLTIGVSSAYFSDETKLEWDKAINLRALINEMILNIPGLMVSEVRIETTLIKKEINYDS